jgi:hypothetical protein
VDNSSSNEVLLEGELDFGIPACDEEQVKTEREVLLLGLRVHKSTTRISLIILVGNGDAEVKIKDFPNKELDIHKLLRLFILVS